MNLPTHIPFWTINDRELLVHGSTWLMHRVSAWLKHGSLGLTPITDKGAKLRRQCSRWHLFPIWLGTFIWVTQTELIHFHWGGKRWCGYIGLEWNNVCVLIITRHAFTVQVCHVPWHQSALAAYVSKRPCEFENPLEWRSLRSQTRLRNHNPHVTSIVNPHTPSDETLCRSQCLERRSERHSMKH